MSYCLRHKNGDWVVGLNLIKEDNDQIKKVTFMTKTDSTSAKFFSSISRIYDDIISGSERASPIGTMSLENYESLKAHFKNLNDCEIWYNHYQARPKDIRVGPLNIEMGLFMYLFKKDCQHELIEDVLPFTSKKLMTRYDFVVSLKLYPDDLEKFTEEVKLIGLDYYMIPNAVRTNNLRFFLINQQDLNFLKLSFDKKIDFKYSRKTNELCQNFKIYKKYLGILKDTEYELNKYLCKTVGGSTYNTNSKRPSF